MWFPFRGSGQARVRPIQRHGVHPLSRLVHAAPFPPSRAQPPCSDMGFTIDNEERFSQRRAFFANEERFSLGGAAHKSLREDSYAGIRAGERKTCWTKPRPGSEGLWALNAPRCFARCAAALPRASIGCSPHSDRAAERSPLPASGRLAAVLAPSTPTRRERRRRDEAGVSASLAWTGGSGS
jgi:hypothetical protein